VDRRVTVFLALAGLSLAVLAWQWRQRPAAQTPTWDIAQWAGA
jgi:hypothetical protein